MAQVISLDRARREPERCRATTVSGRPCRNRAAPNGFCAVHRPPSAPDRIGPFDADWVRRALEFARRRALGDYTVDEFGFDPELTEKLLLPMMKLVSDRYFRTEWVGIRRVPSSGPALLVGNHAGTFPLDAVVLKFGVLDRHPARRHVRLLAADLAFRLPIIAAIARKSGATLACEEDARRLLSNGELLGVFPEGFKGVGKGWKERYKLQRFGRGGFVEVALRERVPIIPVAIVGSEEAYPMLANAGAFARMVGLPYFPITPTFPWLGPLGLLPLPSRWLVEFGEPIRTDGYPEDAWEDAMLVFELTDRIRDTIQQMLYRNLMRRTSPFL
jgi:1-acyl-sn-glycerol-3-phosphate acyltransferase